MRVLVREPIAEAGIELLRDRFEVDVDTETPLEEIVDRYDAIVIRSATKLTREVIERGVRLKVIGRAGVGVDNVDVDAATRRGIVVANAPESTIVSAAEQTIGLLVALARNIPQAHAALKEGRWERSRYAGIEFAGKTLGVVGFGRIGQQVARRALGLAMNVVAFDPFVGRDRFRDLGVEQVETLEELLGGFRRRHAPLAADGRDPLPDRSGRNRPHARWRAGSSTPRAERSSTRRRWRRRSGPGSSRARRSMSSRPSRTRPAARARPGRRHAAPRRLDRRGAGPRGRDRRRAGGGRPRRRRPSRTPSTSPSSTRPTSRCCGPFIPLASQLGRIAVGLAAGAPYRITVAAHGPAFGARHAASHRRRAERRLPGARRPGRERRQRHDDRRRAWHRRSSRSGTAPRRDYTNTVEVRLVSDGEEVTVSGHDDRPRAAALPRRRARLRDRPRDRAAHGVHPVPRPAGGDRPRGLHVRRRGGQHREHGGLADEGGGRGADGLLDRLGGDDGARRPAA